MGCSDSKMREMKSGLPQWTHSLQFDPNMAIGFTSVSEGMDLLTPNNITVTHPGNHTTYGARWGNPLCTGKHVFEAFWPIKKNRGSNSCIGVATKTIPLTHTGRVSLVGLLSRGWCLDMSRRRVIHKNQVVGPARRGTGDRFYIFVDIDAGKVSFGTDIAAYGHQAAYDDGVITNARSDPSDPLYLMVSTPTQHENIQIKYKGTHVPFGGFDLVHSVLMEAQQMQGPPPPANYGGKKKKKERKSSSSSSDSN